MYFQFSPCSFDKISWVSKDMRSIISRSGIQSFGRMLTLTAVMLNLSWLCLLRSSLTVLVSPVMLLNIWETSLVSRHLTLKYASRVMEKSWSDTCSNPGKDRGQGSLLGDHLGNIFDVNLNIDPDSLLVAREVILLVIIRETDHVVPSFVAVTFRQYWNSIQTPARDETYCQSWLCGGNKRARTGEISSGGKTVRINECWFFSNDNDMRQAWG